MVGRLLVLVFFSVAFSAGAEDTTLFGDGAGRVWMWKEGEKTFLTPEGRNLVLGGVGEKSLWGWGIEGDRARFFRLALEENGPQPKDAKKALPLPQFESTPYPLFDHADRVGDRTLLVWGPQSGVRYEVWQAGLRVAARAWDDGRTVYAQALGPQEGWILAGRLPDGRPWLEVSGEEISAPEGWRGRLAVVEWVPEAKTNPAEGTELKPPGDPQFHPWVAGWGAPGSELPRMLLWGPEGWTQSAEAEGSVYPLLGSAGEGLVLLAGWQADLGTGALRPWFWNGLEAKVPGGTADGQPQAFSPGEDGGFLIVRHQSAPWFTKEDGVESEVVEGLGPEDRIVALVSKAKASP